MLRKRKKFRRKHGRKKWGSEGVSLTDSMRRKGTGGGGRGKRKDCLEVDARKTVLGPHKKTHPKGRRTKSKEYIFTVEKPGSTGKRFKGGTSSERKPGGSMAVGEAVRSLRSSRQRREGERSCEGKKTCREKAPPRKLEGKGEKEANAGSKKDLGGKRKTETTRRGVKELYVWCAPATDRKREGGNNTQIGRRGGSLRGGGRVLTARKKNEARGDDPAAS